MKTVVVLQSAYIPWKGYFHLIREADLFVFHDDLQYTRSDWRNRNRIVTPAGAAWLTIPAGSDEKRLICEVEIENQSWKTRHRRIIEQNYCKATYFADYIDALDFLYSNRITNLSEYNQRAISHLNTLLGIETALDDSRRYKLKGRKTERLIRLLRQVEAEEYLSGPAGREYLDEAQFRQAGISLRYLEYPNYPEYPQHYGIRCHEVSILDLLFQVGPRAAEYIWGAGEGPSP